MKRVKRLDFALRLRWPCGRKKLMRPIRRDSLGPVNTHPAGGETLSTPHAADCVPAPVQESWGVASRRGMRMKRIIVGLLALCGLVAMSASATAKVQIRIDLSSQRMMVRSATGAHVWPVSTARAGYVTPRGAYAPTMLKRMHYSRKYHMSPMPHAIFFRGGYAIHGTAATGALGRPASHGCVRLAPGAAARLFQMVQREGATIAITGAAPSNIRVAQRARPATAYKIASAKRRGGVLAYAPAKATRPLKSWVRDPLGY